MMMIVVIIVAVQVGHVRGGGNRARVHARRDGRQGGRRAAGPVVHVAARLVHKHGRILADRALALTGRAARLARIRQERVGRFGQDGGGLGVRIILVMMLVMTGRFVDRVHARVVRMRAWRLEIRVSGGVR